MDQDFILDALEKMRDYIAQETKKQNDSFFKFHYEFESRQREKIDKKDLEAIEKRIIESTEIFMGNKIKNYPDKQDLKKLKVYTNKQLENLYALIQARTSITADGENAILAKKPLGGWSCASCENKLSNMIPYNQEHQAWNRMPYRDPNERMAKVG